MKAFFIVLFPLLSNIYFTVKSNTENFDIQAGIREIDIGTTVVLGVIALVCLFLDYLERGGKWNGNLFLISSNSNRIKSGTNIHINQTINKKDQNEND